MDGEEKSGREDKLGCCMTRCQVSVFGQNLLRSMIVFLVRDRVGLLFRFKEVLRSFFSVAAFYGRTGRHDTTELIATLISDFNV